MRASSVKIYNYVWAEKILYLPFSTLSTDISSCALWCLVKAIYNCWNVDHKWSPYDFHFACLLFRVCFLPLFNGLTDITIHIYVFTNSLHSLTLTL